jgi:hypothetical protein
MLGAQDIMARVTASDGRRRAIRALAACAWFAFCTGCVTPYDPFKIPEEWLRTRVHSVVVQPLVVHPDLVEVERVRPLVEDRVIAMLEEGGFSVVTPEEWRRRWLSIAHDVGEIWDPKTGERDDERYEIAARALRHELATERGVQAQVWLGLYTVRLDSGNRAIDFCGARGDVYWPHPLPARLPAGDRITVAEGLCLGVLVFDMDQQELYSIRHGIEMVETYAFQTHASRPVEERVRNAQVLEAAIDAVIGPFARMRR